MRQRTPLTWRQSAGVVLLWLAVLAVGIGAVALLVWWLS